MNTMNGRHLVSVAVVSAAAMVLGGCSGGGEDEPAATSTTATTRGTHDPDVAGPEGTQAPPSEPSTSSSTVTPTDTRPPEVADPSKTMVKSATTYLTARENAVSYKQKDPDSWLDQAKPAMTDEGLKKMSAAFKSARPDATWDEAHSNGLSVKVTLDCSVQKQGAGGKSVQWLQCGVTDRTMGKDGKPLPLSKLPSTWPYSGKQPQALLQMKKQGGKWLVNNDYTGQAS